MHALSMLLVHVRPLSPQQNAASVLHQIQYLKYFALLSCLQALTLFPSPQLLPASAPPACLRSS